MMMRKSIFLLLLYLSLFVSLQDTLAQRQHGSNSQNSRGEIAEFDPIYGELPTLVSEIIELSTTKFEPAIILKFNNSNIEPEEIKRIEFDVEIVGYGAGDGLLHWNEKDTTFWVGCHNFGNSPSEFGEMGGVSLVEMRLIRQIINVIKGDKKSARITTISLGGNCPFNPCSNCHEAKVLLVVAHLKEVVICGNYYVKISNPILEFERNGNIYRIVPETDYIAYESGNDCPCSGCKPVLDEMNKTLEGNQGTNLKLFPNPATDYFYLDLENKEDELVNISVFNIAGQQIYQQSLMSSQKQILISTNDWKNGLYIVHIQTNKGILQKKISIAR